MNLFLAARKNCICGIFVVHYLFAVSPLVLTFHPLLLFSLSSHFLSNFTFSAPDKLQEKHVWVLRVICSLDLATSPPRSRSCRRALSLTVHCSLGTMSAEVENSSSVSADASIATPALNSSSPPTSPATSKAPFKKEKKKGE